MVFPLLTIVSTQLVGAEEAGKFSIAFVTGTLIMIACNYGVRNFQVSDIDEKDVLCLLPAQPLDLRSARAGMRPGIQQRPRLRCADGHNRPGVYLYKVIDGIADVYEDACSRPTNSTWPA